MTEQEVPAPEPEETENGDDQEPETPPDVKTDEPEE